GDRGNGSTTDTEKINIAVIVPQKRGDLGFTDSIYKGFEDIKATYGDKVNITFTECAGDSSRFESIIYDTCDQGPDLIITPSGAGFADLIATKAAIDYPDVNFVLVDTNFAYKGITTNNVCAISYKQNEATFLTGALAALLSESGIIGYVAGMSNAVINDFTVGYIQGAQYINPDIKIHISYIGDFADSAKAKELAATQIGLGADVVAQVAGTAGLGVLDAAKEAGVWGIGVDADQSAAYKESNPEMSAIIASSAMKNGAKLLLSIVERYLNDKDLPWGGLESQGLIEGAVEIAPIVDGISEDIVTKIADLEAKVISGEIKVESAFAISEEEFNAYVQSCQ
ncbi:MAG: BMP family ABC transporter substrate-binding protein, partial [Erysipelotrichaceae bacterium]